jgi:hypothetical protein
MPASEDERVRTFGTRVRLFPQAPFLPGFGEPEVVWLSPPAGTVRPGPADDRIYVIDPVEKPEPYQFPYLPPFLGFANPPVIPSAEGHFDHLPTDGREFLAVHAYGSIRRVLDIFESYFGRRLPWQFSDAYERLEVIPLLDWDNAQSGYGFMEFGYDRDETSRDRPYALNFDIIAHEVGHAVLFSAMGLPAEGMWTPEFGAFHECSADLIALVSLMHFDTVLDRLLHATRGNLYVLNELNRVGELSETRQIRIASNGRKMSEVSGEVHDRARPLIGAFFDLFVYFYVEELYGRGLVGADLRNATLSDDFRGSAAARLQTAFDTAYANRHFLFRAAAAQARDGLGVRLTGVWNALSPNDLGYADVLTALLAIDRGISGMRFQSAIQEIFHWREIFEYVTYPALRTF